MYVQLGVFEIDSYILQFFVDKWVWGGVVVNSTPARIVNRLLCRVITGSPFYEEKQVCQQSWITIVSEWMIVV
jgi:hypothetical protein